MTEPRTGEPVELIHAPGGSWGPPLTALGIALLFVGAYLWFVYAVAGALVLITGLRIWLSQSADEIEALPREQELTTDVVPPVTN